MKVTVPARVIYNTNDLPRREREAVIAAQAAIVDLGDRITPQNALDQLQGVIAARARTVRRSRYDRRSRILVGARIPRALADHYRECAEIQGKSLYAWVNDALTWYSIFGSQERDPGSESNEK